MRLVLAAVRNHLGMDVAFVSRFRDHDRVLEFVDTREGKGPIHAGDVIPLTDGYCQKIIDGRLPGLIPDTRKVAAARDIPETRLLPIGSHVSVPIRLSGGQLYGTFCCFGFEDNSALSERDMSFMRAFADLIASDLEHEMASTSHEQASVDRIERALAAGQPDIHFQPILDIRRGAIAGFECLSRFAAEPGATVAKRPPDAWFRDAHQVGLGAELEITAIRHALSTIERFDPGLYLSVNCSAATILTGRLPAVFADFPCRRVVIEITEHDSIADYPALLRALAPLRAAGIRIAIDDTGAGYASLRHVLELEPETIKLDITLTRSLEDDSKRRALVAALVAFARGSGAIIVAEGVETPAEKEVLVSLGVDCLQGYLIGRPVPLPQALQLAQLPADQFAGIAAL